MYTFLSIFGISFRICEGNGRWNTSKNCMYTFFSNHTMVYTFFYACTIFQHFFGFWLQIFKIDHNHISRTERNFLDLKKVLGCTLFVHFFKTFIHDTSFTQLEEICLVTKWVRFENLENWPLDNSGKKSVHYLLYVVHFCTLYVHLI